MVVELIILAVIVGVVLLAALYVMGTYNNLVTLRNRVENAWAQIDVQLKRRYDLIPNLVETVKGYMKHERETLENVTKYRAQLVTGNPAQRAAANNMITEALKTIFSVAENYPKLEASQNFKVLQEELMGTENKISFVRTAYNDNVLTYNTALQVFPTNVIAGMFGFVAKVYFEVVGAEREATKVKF